MCNWYGGSGHVGSRYKFREEQKFKSQKEKKNNFKAPLTNQDLSGECSLDANLISHINSGVFINFLIHTNP